MKMNKLIVVSLVGLTLLYIMAGIAMRVDALNQCTWSLGGWLFLACAAVVAFAVVVCPMWCGIRLPEWRNPSAISDLGARRVFVRKYAEAIVKHFGGSKSKGVGVEVERLYDAFVSPSGTEEYFAKLEDVTVAAREWLVGPVCDETVKRYMKRAAILIAVSQRGWLDGLAMFYMQIKMIGEIIGVMGYRPSWILRYKCYLWIAANSLVFALVQDVTELDSALTELIAALAGEKAANEAAGGVPFLGRIASSFLQGVSAMATVYATGRLAQRFLVGDRKASAKERIRLRIEGLAFAKELAIHE